MGYLPDRVTCGCWAGKPQADGGAPQVAFDLFSKHIDFFQPAIAGHQVEAQARPAGIDLASQTGLG